MTARRTTLGETADGKRVYLDLEHLVGSRMLLQANSGGGKSWALRRLLERTHGQIQQLVIDPEGEFYTLRSKFDYVLAGRGSGDCPAEPKSAHLLARRLLELGTSAILDVYELKAHERVRFVRRFLEALVDAPRKLWHPVLVVVDEAHVYCPQKGQAESAAAVIDLMSRGRKRGFCGVLATQRISKLHKDAAAEANNYLIGRAALDLDMKRAADELGFSGRDEQQRLRRLRPGEFFAFGPALADEVTQIRVGSVETSHPKAGARAAPPAPPRAKVKAVLSQLADLPGEAEQEARTVETLQRDLREARTEIRRLAKGAGVPSPEDLERARQEGFAAGQRRVAEVVRLYQDRTEQATGALDRALVDIAKARDAIAQPIDIDLAELPRPVPRPALPARAPRPVVPRAPTTSGEAPTFGGGCLRMLQVLASRSPAGFTIAQWATLAGLKKTGGTWSTYLSRLRTAGYVVRHGDLWKATEEGIDACGEVPAAPETPAEVLAMWKTRLGGGPARMLDVIVQAPDGVTRDELAEAVGITRSGGTFGTYLSRLTSNGLVEKDGDLLRAAGVLGEVS